MKAFVPALLACCALAACTDSPKPTPILGAPIVVAPAPEVVPAPDTETAKLDAMLTAHAAAPRAAPTKHVTKRADPEAAAYAKAYANAAHANELLGKHWFKISADDKDAMDNPTDIDLAF